MARVSVQGLKEKTINDFKGVVRDKYDKLHTVYGLEIEKALKLYLALEGDVSYQNDPDVRTMMSSISSFDLNTHTHGSGDGVESGSDLRDTIVHEQKEYKSDRSMQYFAQIFREEYGDWSQVSYGEISNLAVRMQGVSDKRSIVNRICYLQGLGMIEPHAPNVYNIK